MEKLCSVEESEKGLEGGGEAVHTPSGLYIWTNRASAVVQSNSRQNKIEARGQTSNTISRD